MLGRMERHHLEFTRDPAHFLAVAGPWLAAEPVVGTVVTTVAQRTAAEILEGLVPPPADWWLVVRDRAGAVVGTAMRTAPFGARPLFVLPMPEAAARQLARSLHERGEVVGAANGVLPAVRALAEETARLTGSDVSVAAHTRLFELGELLSPTPVPGRLRLATVADVELVRAWFALFMEDADEQSGRPRGSSAALTPTADDLLRRIQRGSIWLWVDATGRPVHLTGANPPAYGVARIGPVFTPVEHRGRGLASAAVWEVAARLRDAGNRVCLFTDQANPTSNRIYQALGFRPVVDMANLLVT